MTSPLDNGNRWAVLGMTIFLLGSGALFVDQAPALALVNESPSLPRGLYGRTGEAVTRGVTVAIPQPEAVRPYLASLGMPADTLLIKRVAAGAGDRVCVQDQVLTTPGGRRAVLVQDRLGTVLPVWSGCRRLAADELFLLGDTVGSFDSRYFGPVKRSEVRGVYREVWTW